MDDTLSSVPRNLSQRFHIPRQRLVKLSAFLLAFFVASFFTLRHLIRQEDVKLNNSLYAVSTQTAASFSSCLSFFDTVLESETFQAFSADSWDPSQSQQTSLTMQKVISRLCTASGLNRNSVVLIRPWENIAITPLQYYSGMDYLSWWTNGVLESSRLLEPSEPLSWRTLCAEGRAWLIRSMIRSGHVTACILLELPFSSLVPLLNEEQLILVGNQNGIVYTNADLAAEQYPGILEQVDHFRRFTLSGKTYEATQNVFSAIDLQIVSALPVPFSLRFPSLPFCLLASLLLTLLLAGGLEAAHRLFGRRKASVPLMASYDAENMQFTLGQALSLLTAQSSPDPHLVHQLLDLSGISSTDGFFLIGLFEDKRGLPAEITDAESAEKRRLLYELLDKRFFSICPGTLLRTESFILMIIEGDEADDPADMQNALRSVQEAYSQSTGISLLVTEPRRSNASTLKEDLEHLRITIDHRQFCLTDLPESVSPRKGDLDPDYFSLMAQLLSCFEQGDFRNASRIFHQTLDTCLPKDAVNLSVAKNRIHTMLDMLMSYTGLQAENLTLDVLKIDNIDKIRRRSDEIFSMLIARQQSAADNTSVVQRHVSTVQAYVQEHYGNPDLSVAFLAEQFNLNPAYLSRIFKESTGENLLAYIQSVRIAAAKKLLATHSVKETMELVGFSDMQSFKRTFRKFDPLTPAEYRKQFDQPVS